MNTYHVLNDLIDIGHGRAFLGTSLRLVDLLRTSHGDDRSKFNVVLGL